MEELLAKGKRRRRNPVLIQFIDTFHFHRAEWDARKACPSARPRRVFRGFFARVSIAAFRWTLWIGRRKGTKKRFRICRQSPQWLIQVKISIKNIQNVPLFRTGRCLPAHPFQLKLFFSVPFGGHIADEVREQLGMATINFILPFLLWSKFSSFPFELKLHCYRNEIVVSHISISRFGLESIHSFHLSLSFSFAWWWFCS